MKRTYFVPLCILAIFMVVAGIVTFVLVGILEGYNEWLTEDFVSHYEKSSDYQALYREALSKHIKLQFEITDGSYFKAAVSLTFGLLILLWALDRRRLIRRYKELESKTAAEFPE